MCFGLNFIGCRFALLHVSAFLSCLLLCWCSYVPVFALMTKKGCKEDVDAFAAFFAVAMR